MQNATQMSKLMVCTLVGQLVSRLLEWFNNGGNISIWKVMLTESDERLICTWHYFINMLCADKILICYLSRMDVFRMACHEWLTLYHDYYDINTGNDWQRMHLMILLTSLAPRRMWKFTSV